MCFHLSRRIYHWQWIDRFIHRCLIPQPSSDVFRDPRAALEYRIKQEEFFDAKSFIPENLSTKPRVRMTAYPLPNKHGETVFQQLSSSFANSPICHMEIIKGEGISSTTRLNHNVQSDCILYFVDESRSRLAEFATFAAHLSSDQNLAIVIVKDTAADSRTDFACLMDFLNHLDYFYKMRLFLSLGHWRLWCLPRDGENNVQNVEEVITWLGDITLWRMSQSLR